MENLKVEDFVAENARERGAAMNFAGRSAYEQLLVSMEFV